MKYILILSLLGLLSCAKDPVETKQTNNDQFPVSLLFEQDGCKVYRFYDVGHHHYYAQCGNKVTTNSTKKCGKNCSRNEEIPTENQ